MFSKPLCRFDECNLFTVLASIIMVYESYLGLLLILPNALNQKCEVGISRHMSCGAWHLHTVR